MTCLGMHSNVMLRFMVHAFQDPPLCSTVAPSYQNYQNVAEINKVVYTVKGKRAWS